VTPQKAANAAGDSGGEAVILEASGVGKRFGNLVALRDVSLKVSAGELRAIIGPNGAGKTTFFNLLSGLFVPTTGRVFFEGRDITRTPAHQRVRLGIARTFQITEIFPELSVYDNLRIGAEAANGYGERPWITAGERAIVRRQVEEALARAGLRGKAQRLVGELAHGDQRVVEIATALTLRPRLLLLDEPTAGLGDQETAAVVKLVGELHEDDNLTIILIEHDMQVVFNLADRISVLDQGALLAEGVPAEIAANAAVQEAYLGKTA
jgi:branched-chain amino acid transport system ATP-binding protein